MKPVTKKPQGTSGPISVGPQGVEWNTITFPSRKEEREQLLAKLFVNSFGNYVAMQSTPSLAPFHSLIQNKENDLDFTVHTMDGTKLMELAEFAPLQSKGQGFSNAPKSIEPKEKSALALELIKRKSAHQGGNNRFLVIYVTEQGFWLDPFTIERIRRGLNADYPRFDRIYYLGIHDLIHASVSEIYPGTAHHIAGTYTDEELDRCRVLLPHPSEMIVGRTFEWTGTVRYGGRPVPARIKVDVVRFEPKIGRERGALD